MTAPFSTDSMKVKTLPKIYLRAPETHRDLDRLFRWEHTQRRGFDVSQDAPPAPSRMELWEFLNNYRHSLADDRQLRYMVDTDDPEEIAVTVGYVDLCDYDAATATAYVSIFTAESMRRRGYARAALSALEDRCKTLGVRHLRVAVSLSNEPSRCLFAAAGYTSGGDVLFTKDI